MDNGVSQFAKRIEPVVSNLKAARARIMNIERTDRFRDYGEIWEAYCDVEQAIMISKFVFKLDSKLGVLRALRASIKNNPSDIPKDELIAKYGIVESALGSSISEFEEGRCESGIMHARIARDELKMLLLGSAKAKNGKKRKMD